MSEVATEAWVITWKRHTGPLLAKCSASGVADVDLYLDKEEAERWCEVLKTQDGFHTPNQSLRPGVREVRKVLFEADTGRLAGYIALVLNGRFVELSGGLDTELKSGDTLRLMPGFSGG